MKIVVCVKQVPGAIEIKVGPVKNTLIRTGVPSILGPFDRNTVETVFQLKDAYGEKVTVLSMGPPQAKTVLKEAPFAGADRACLTMDRAFGGSGTYAIGYILSSAIRHLESSGVVLGGRQTIDGGTGRAAPSIAEHLGMIRLTYIISMEIQGDRVITRHQVEEDVEVTEAKFPVLYTTTKRVNRPCYTTIRGRLKSLEAEIPKLILEDMKDVIDITRIGLKGLPTKVRTTFASKRTTDRVYMVGGPQSMTALFLDCLRGSEVLQERGRVVGFEQCKNVWVFVGCFEGTSKSVGLELLGQGEKLAEDLGQQLYAVVIGKEVESAAQAVGIYSAGRIYVVQEDECGHHPADGYGYTFLGLYKEYNPNTILMGATINGRGLDSKLAVSLYIRLTADYTVLSVGDTGDVVRKRSAFGGGLYAQILCSEIRPQMGTVRPGTFKEPVSLAESQTRTIHGETHADHIRTQVIQFIRACTNGTIPVGGTGIIVSDDHGMKNSEDFAILKELADLLGGTVGCSRAAVDSRWMPQSRQMRQIGSTVTPKLYTACGVSGAAQHVAGMSELGAIMAVNKDASAPIFEVMGYHLVGDLFEIIPALTKELKVRKQVRGSRWMEWRRAKSKWSIT